MRALPAARGQVPGLLVACLGPAPRDHTVSRLTSSPSAFPSRPRHIWGHRPGPCLALRVSSSWETQADTFQNCVGGCRFPKV